MNCSNLSIVFITFEGYAKGFQRYLTLEAFICFN